MRHGITIAYAKPVEIYSGTDLVYVMHFVRCRAVTTFFIGARARALHTERAHWGDAFYL